jgi:hypothetical protein
MDDHVEPVGRTGSRDEGMEQEVGNQGLGLLESVW